MTEGHHWVVESARRGFAETFGSDPSGVWLAPGRINLIGEHTDYNGGFVLPFALDRCVAVAATLGDDGQVDLVSSQTGSRRFSVEQARRGGPGLGHAEAAIWAALAAGVDLPGLEVYVSSALPVGAGLSSSAAFICGLLTAVVNLTDHDVTPLEIALAAQRAETEGVGVPIGVMDPMVVMVSLEGHGLLLDCQSLEYEHVPLEASAPRGDTEILIVDTRTERRLSTGEYAERRRSCQKAAAALGVASLRDVSPDFVVARSADLGELVLKRARHVVTENVRVHQAVERLRDGDAPGLGKLLDESHRSLAEDFEVSAPALDLAVEVCRDSGAYGARLTGAGFGGCVIGLFPSGSLRSVEASVASAFQAQRMNAPRVFGGTSGPPAKQVFP